MSVLTRECEIENRKMTEEGENQDSLPGKKILSVLCANVRVRLGFWRLPLICRLRRDSHLLKILIPDTQKSVTTTFWSLSRCQIFRDPISTLMLGLLPFSNFYVNLFLTSALGFKADSFPTEMWSFSFYNLLHFLIFLSSHAVPFSLLFPSSVSHSPLLWLCLLSYCFYTSHYNYRIIGVVVEILHGAREKHHEKKY